MMDQNLARALDGLRLSTAEPDIQARAANLKALVTGPHLSINELRLIKDLLSSVTLHKDIVPNLPVELVILVTNHLGEEDIPVCLGVSRRWRATFMNERVLFYLADRWFPHLTWDIQASSLQDEASRAQLGLDFLHSLRKRLRLTRRLDPLLRPKIENHYLWDTELNFRLEGQAYSQFPAPNLPVTSHALYAHGRVAWQRETHTLVVDNLASRIRKILTFPGGKLLGPEMDVVALGDKLAVAYMDRHLLAWDIESTQFERITLPAVPWRCTTAGHQVTVTIGKEIYIWTFGARLLSLDFQGLDSPPMIPYHRYAQAFIHPRREEVVFVRQVFKPTEHTLQFKVDKFVHRRYDRTFLLDVPMRRLPNQNLRSSIMGFIPLTYQWRPATPEAEEGHCLHEFDVYHESFIERRVSRRRNRHPDSFLFTLDDDFAVELSEGTYWVW